VSYLAHNPANQAIGKTRSIAINWKRLVWGIHPICWNESSLHAVAGIHLGE